MATLERCFPIWHVGVIEPRKEKNSNMENDMTRRKMADTQKKALQAD